MAGVGLLVAHLAQEVSVQAGLSYRPGPGVVRTQPELEVSPVVGRQLHLHLQELGLAQVGCQHPQAVLTAQLAGSGLGKIIGVTTDSTQPLVLRPLPPVSTTVALMVVHIGRSVKAVPPHGGARGRLSESAMAGDSASGETVRYEDQQQHSPSDCD